MHNNKNGAPCDTVDFIANKQNYQTVIPIQYLGITLITGSIYPAGNFVF